MTLPPDVAAFLRELSTTTRDLPPSIKRTARALVDKYAAPAPTRRLAPSPDFAGNPIHEGDTLRHPNGPTFVARYSLLHQGLPDSAWWADYGPGHAAGRLSLQVGDKGRAVLVKP